MIRKAVIPAAGYGTRLLLLTKSLPKEMLPIVDRPVIQYVVEEAAAAGIQDVLIIISRGKRAIEEHFDRHPELEAVLTANGRTVELESLHRLSSMARIHFDWQQTLRGLGDAVACARDHVGREPFAVLLGDTVVRSTVPATLQLTNMLELHGGAMVALEEVLSDKVSRYGVIRGLSAGGRLYRIDGLEEKPPPESAPSNLAVAGRYVLTPDIFDILERTTPGRNGEIQLTDALNEVAEAGRLKGVRIDGRRYDIGSRLDWLQANIDLALERPDVGPGLRGYLTALLGPGDATDA